MSWKKVAESLRQYRDCADQQRYYNVCLICGGCRHVDNLRLIPYNSISGVAPSNSDFAIVCKFCIIKRDLLSKEERDLPEYRLSA